ncbi:MAG: RNA-directed DNA polymerase [Clostridia bacterium]|nr:RNA-directed DNA polymerase [Clostridia bacterium]
MKSVRNVYQNLLDIERIKEIIILAAKGKKKRKEVIDTLNDIDNCANQILEMLRSGEFKQRPVKHRTIKERGKKRLLTISPFFPNRILDYIVTETLKPYIRKSMYEYCVGNVDKRGISYGKKVTARNYKKYKYYIKLDICKFYPSVKAEKLLGFIRRKVQDERFCNLCAFVVGACDELPIGSYYSQWFSNWFLEDVDHYIKEELKVPFYIRYVDDMVLMGNNKRKLLNAMYNVSRKLEEKGLRLKEKAQVHQPQDKPIDFLGFRFGKEVRLRQRTFRAINKRVAKIRKKKHICVSQARSLLSYTGWLAQIKQGYSYYISEIRNTAKNGLLRRIVSKYEKTHRTALPKLQETV